MPPPGAIARPTRLAHLQRLVQLEPPLLAVLERPVRFRQAAFALPEAVTQAALRVASPSTYASYRSAGGHAVAQVIMPGAEAVVASLTTTAVLTQTQTLLGMWRAMLGA